MFRVEVLDVMQGHGDFSIPALFAGTKPGEKANTTIPMFADIDCSPDEYIEYLRIELAQEAVRYLQDKGYEAKILSPKSAASLDATIF